MKFAMKPKFLKKLFERPERPAEQDTSGVPVTRTRSHASTYESLYANRVSFLKRAARKVGLKRKVSIKPEELQRVGSIQLQRASDTLARNPSRTASG